MKQKQYKDLVTRMENLLDIERGDNGTRTHGAYTYKDPFQQPTWYKRAYLEMLEMNCAQEFGSTPCLDMALKIGKGRI